MFCVIACATTTTTTTPSTSTTAAHPPRQLLDLCRDGGQALEVRILHDRHHEARRGLQAGTGRGVRDQDRG